MAQEQSLVAKLSLKLQEALQSAKQGKAQLKGDFEEIQKSAVVKPTIDAPAITAVKSKISDLKSQLEKLKSGQHDLIDVKAIKASEAAISSTQAEIAHLTGTLDHLSGEDSKVSGFFSKLKSHLTEVKKSAESAEGGEGGKGGISGMLSKIGGAGLGMVGGVTAGAFALEKLFEAGKEAKERDEQIVIGLRTMGLSAEQAEKSLQKVKDASQQTAQSLALDHAEIENATAAYLKMGGTLDDLPEKQATIAALAQRGNMDMESAARMLARTTDDDLGSLQKFGIQLDKNATQAQKAETIHKALAGTIEGMKDAADGPLGGFKRLQDMVTTLTETLGKLLFEALGPVIKVLTGVMSVIMPLVQWFGELWAKINPLTVVMNLLNEASEKFAPIWEQIKTTFEKLKPTFETVGHMFSELWTSVKGIGEALFTAIKHLFGFGEGASNSAGFMQKLGDAIGFVAKVIETIVRGVQGTIGVVELIVSTLSEALQNFDIFHPGKMLAAFDNFGAKAAKAFNDAYNRTDAEDPNSPGNKEPKEPKKKKGPKEHGEAKALQDSINEQIAYQKERHDLQLQDRVTTIANLQKLYDVTQDANKTKVALNEEDLKQLADMNKKRLQMGQDVVTKEQYQEQLRLRALDSVKKAIQEQQKAMDEDLKKAGVKEATAMEQSKAEIRQKLKEKLAAITQAVKDDGMAESDANDARLKAQQEADAALLKVDADYQEKLRKQREEARNKLAEQLKFHINEESKLQGMRDQTIQDSMKREIALANDKAAKELAILEEEHAAGKISDEEYQLSKTQAEQTAADERLKILKDHLAQENVLYNAATTGVKSIFGDLTNYVKNQIELWLGFKKSMSANDQALELRNKQKSEANLRDQLTRGKLDYQDYVLQKTKLEEDYNAKMKQNSVSLTDMLKKAEESVVMSVIDAIAKKAEAWIADQLTRLALSLVYRASDTAAATAQASALATIWAPAASLASIASFGAADVAATAGITTTMATTEALSKIPGAAEGEFITDGIPGKDSVLRRVMKGETIVDPQTTAALGGPSFLPRAKEAARNIDRDSFNMYMSGNIIPRVSPSLQPGFQSHSTPDSVKLNRTLDRLHDVAKDLRDNGIDARVPNKEFRKGIKNNPRDIEASTRRRKQTIATRGRPIGGGFSN